MKSQTTMLSSSGSVTPTILSENELVTTTGFSGVPNGACSHASPSVNMLTPLASPSFSAFSNPVACS